MRKVWIQVRYRAKALLAAAGLAAVGIAEYVVTDPDTATELGKALPAPYSQLVPVLLALFAAGLVHAIPNGAAPVGSAAAVPVDTVSSPAPDTAAAALPAPAAEPSTATSMVALVPAPGPMK